MRRATPVVLLRVKGAGISIHALLAESDSMFTSLCCGCFAFLSTLSLRRATGRHRGNDRCPVNFYPRSPCGERPIFGEINARRSIFLSTLSLRRATAPPYNLMIHHKNFYPRSPCGERHLGNVRGCFFCVFLSTLSLRRATLLLYRLFMTSQFLSTLSLRRATQSGHCER